MTEKAKPCRRKLAGGPVRLHTKRIRRRGREADAEKILRMYPSHPSQCAIENASGIRSGKAELLGVGAELACVSAEGGLYRAVLRFFYRMTAEAVLEPGRGVTIRGLAVFRRQMLLKEHGTKAHPLREIPVSGPETVKDGNRGLLRLWVRAERPALLDLGLAEACGGPAAKEGLVNFPPGLCDVFHNDLYFGREGRQISVTLRQPFRIGLSLETGPGGA